MKKLHKLLFAISSTLLVGLSTLTGVQNKSVTPIETKAADTVYGNDIIYLYTTTAGTNYFNTNDARKFTFNQETECYELTYVLFEGDYFAPYVTNRSYAYWTDKYASANEQFAENHIGRYSASSYFLAQKSGTYKISLDKNVSVDLTNTWQYTETSYIKYVSDSTKFADPVGNEVIYLYGTFDGTSSYTTVQSRKFTYNRNEKAYKLTISLYKGDIFCPYMTAPKNRYVYYMGNEYCEVLYKENHVGKYSVGSEGYFVCEKDGTYEISLDYSVEFLQTAKDTWKQEFGSKITYLSGEIISKAPKGTDKIYLYGVFNGTSKMSTSTATRLEYNPTTKSYVVNVDLEVGDTFRFYIDIRSVYLNYLTGDTYATAMFEGSQLIQYGTYYWQAQIAGTYEISISYKVEYLDSVNDIWKSHGNSYIRYIGKYENTKSSYIVLGDNYDADATYKVKVEGNKNIYQYSSNGMIVKPTSYVTFNGKTNGALSNSIIKVDYNPTYSQTFELIIDRGETEKVYTGSLNPGYGYSIVNNEVVSSKDVGDACMFLCDLESSLGSYKVNEELTYDKSIDSLSQEDAIRLKAEYIALSDAAQAYVDASLINNDGEDVTVLSLIPTIKKLGTLPFKFPTEVLVILIAVPVLLLGTLFLLGLKRRDDRNIITFAKDDEELEGYAQ